MQKDDDILLEVQCHKIDAVLIFGNVQFTTQAVHELFEHGIEMAILTRTGKLIGQITSPSAKNITLRLHQFRRYEDNEFRVRLSKEIVSGKIRNSLNLIRTFSFNHPEIDSETETTNLGIRLRQIDSLHDIEGLLGLEGMAARDYFKAFGKMILADFTFTGRKKHPSPDPVNALLSLAYTMLYNEISSLLDGLGFDPYLGYYHSIDYGRASLASDIMEEFRAPVGDRFTLYLLNNQIIRTDDFYTNPQTMGVYLKQESLRKYFTDYENLLNREFIHPRTKEKTTFRKCFRIQAENLAESINRDTPYSPFLLEV